MNATAWTHTLNGTTVPTCTTIYFGFKPSANSTILTVDPQATKAIIVTENPEAATDWLQLWGPDSFSIFPPFFKFHAKINIDWLGVDVGSWIGLFACGIDTSSGMGRLLQGLFEDAPQATFEAIRSAFISSMTASTALFVASMIAATFTSMTPAYYLTLIAYTIGGIVALAIAYALPDVSLSRAILFGVGATLLSLLIGAFSANVLVRSIPYMIQTEVTGGDPVRLAVRSLTNTIINNFLGITSVGIRVIMTNPLMMPLAVVTLGIAVSAIYLGWTKE